MTVTNLARTLRELKERDLRIIGADDAAATGLYGADLSGPLAWVLGAEGEGLRRLVAEQNVEEFEPLGVASQHHQAQGEWRR